MRQPSGGDRELLEVIRASITHSGLFQPGKVLLVGVSGGPDSLCLLHGLAYWRTFGGPQIVAGHLDHGLRRGGAGETALVERVSAGLDIPCHSERRSVRSWMRTHPDVSSLEEAARQVRYGFFADVAAQVGAAAVAVGHTAGDQVETILLHLLRGTGIAGLRGMSADTLWPDGALHVVRPLLGVQREAVRAYCVRHQLAFLEDPSNRSLRFTRNRVRSRLLPLLRSFNPAVDQSLLQLAKLAEEEEAYWAGELPRLAQETLAMARGSAHLAMAPLRALPVAAQRRLLRAAYAALTGGVWDLQHSHVAAMLRLLSRGAGKRVSLPGGTEAVTRYGELVLQRVSEPPAGAPAAPLRVPGETLWNGWRLTARLHPGAVLPGGLGPWHAALDYAKAEGAVIRSRRAGDRYRPTGMARPKKLQDLFVDAHVPAPLRPTIPVVEGPSGIAWVGGMRVAEEFKVLPGTAAVLEICVEAVSEPATLLADVSRSLSDCDNHHYTYLNLARPV